jgi:tetratricopeptide (TPR) repeat protein
VAHSHLNLGGLLAAQGRWDEAEREDRQALAEWGRLAADHPGVPEYRRGLAHSHLNLGDLLSGLCRPDEAGAAHRQALALYDRLAADHPGVLEYRRGLAQSRDRLGGLLASLGRRDEAEREDRRAVAECGKLAAEYPGVPEYAADLGSSYYDLGSLLGNSGDPSAARECYAKAIACLQPIIAQDRRMVKARQDLRNSLWGRAVALMQLNRHAEAVPDWERAIELSDAPDRLSFRLWRAQCLARAGDPAKAVAEAEELAQGNGTGADTLYNCACILAAVAVRADAPTADRHAGRAVAVLRQAVAKGYSNIPRLLRDADLTPLCRRSDYAALLWDLADTPTPRP